MPFSPSPSTLYFGGSFNPLHAGHLICARAVAEAAGYSRIVLIPSAQPPHKPESADLADACHRLEMCRLVAANDPLFQADDLELRRNGPSFTIDTVRHLRAAGHPGPIPWLIGADMALSLMTWRQPLELIAEAKLILMARPGWTLSPTDLTGPLASLRHNIIPAPHIDISATHIRARIKSDQSVRYLVPDYILRYIETHRLYR